MVLINVSNLTKLLEKTSKTNLDKLNDEKNQTDNFFLNITMDNRFEIEIPNILTP
jgi:hypothetical protein